MSISLFDNILLMLTDRIPNQCGMLGSCSMQFVVEADGSVYPCDFYVLDEYCCGNVFENSVEEIGKSEALRAFFEKKNKTGSNCVDCPFWGICRGGCKRQQGSYLQEGRCAHREFLEYAYPTMRKIAQTI